MKSRVVKTKMMTKTKTKTKMMAKTKTKTKTKTKMMRFEELIGFPVPDRRSLASLVTWAVLLCQGI